ncbi:MAG: class I SAM-dependent methyltransferase, partial [Nevskia sp.]|nr:class I SAM-dependent methyltransferase [Nevskia sp.]
SPWKAERIFRFVRKNGLQPASVAEIGCGVGLILDELSEKDGFQQVVFKGFDVSPQAIAIASERSNARISFHCEDPLAADNHEHFDLLLAIDVFEHVPDYMGFVGNCRKKAAYTLYHIPLDLHVSSVLRASFINTRASIGHLHYFTAESAIATLKDTGHEIVDWEYTCATLDLFRLHPSFKKAVANLGRWLVSRISEAAAARWFGGYSMLVLAR